MAAAESSRRRATSAAAAVVVALLALAVLTDASALLQKMQVHGRYDYKRSFKKPYFVPTADGGSNSIPHFAVVGDAILSPDYIRLAASVRSQRGAVWSTLPTDYKHWSVEIKFLISGRGRLGGDGIAFWYTKESQQIGHVYGNRDQWDGLGIALDTYDNDGQHNNPIVIAMLNDGTSNYDHNKDGSGQEVASCQRHFRNPSGPTAMRIDYIDDTLTVSMDTAESGKAYVQCFQIQDIDLPQGYFFGISAATGGLADDHDVFSFEVKQLFGGQDKNAPAPEEAHLSHEQQQQLDNVQQKVQEMREQQEKEQSGGSAKDENRGYSIEMEAVLAKLDAMVAMQMELSKQLDVSGSRPVNIVGGSASTINQANVQRLMEDSQRTSHLVKEIETTVKKLNQNSGGDGNNNNAFATLERRLSNVDTVLQGQSNTLNKLSQDINQLNHLLQAGGGGSVGGSVSTTTLYIILGIVALLGVGFGIYTFLKGSSKNDFKKFA